MTRDARLVLTGVSVIDGISPTPVHDASVVIEEGRITEVLDGSSSPDTRDASVIELDGSFVMPGLWDVHVHPEYPSPPGASIAQQTADFGAQLSRALTDGGVTSVRCGGAANYMDVAWRQIFDTRADDWPTRVRERILPDHNRRTLS